MPADHSTHPEALLVAHSDSLSARIAPALNAWSMRVRSVTEAEALSIVHEGTNRIVLVELATEPLEIIRRIRDMGGVPVSLALDGQPHSGDGITKLADVVPAIYRAHGELISSTERDLDRINRFAQAIATQFTLPELMQVAITKTRELCEADGASLLLVDRNTGELYFDVVDGLAADRIERVRLPKGNGVAGRVAIEAQPRLVASTLDCADFDPSVDKRSGFSTGSIVAAPLVLSGEVLGVLMAVRSTTRVSFATTHLEQLVNLAPHVAIAVHNAQITAALRASQADVMQTNANLEQKVRERTEMISNAKQEWERTFDVISDPIALMDGYVVRRANKAYARLAGGVPIREIPGKTCHQLLAGRDTPCPGCPLAAGRSNELKAELELTEPIGRTRGNYRFSGYWMSDAPTNNTVVVHYQDITQSKHMAERLRETERLAAVGQLASGAAHEINNPLGFVTSNLRSLRSIVDELGEAASVLVEAVALVKANKMERVLQILKETRTPDGQTLRDSLEMIDESLDGARRVGEIVKGLRELARLEIGKREPADVNASVTRIVRQEFGDAPANVTLELTANVMADIAPLQLDQALAHILRNARQAIQPSQRVTITTSTTRTEVVIIVRDEGVGIPRENLRRVFEPFFTTRGVGKGIGLGLTAAYGIVKRSGGDIDVDSEGSGKGTTITIRVPRIGASDVFANVA